MLSLVEAKKHFPVYWETAKEDVIDVPICKPGCKKCWGRGYVKSKINGKVEYKAPFINNLGEEVSVCHKSRIIGIDVGAYIKLVSPEEEEGEESDDGV